MIKVRLFGIARDIVGDNLLVVEEPVKTVAELLKYIQSKYPDFNKLTSLLIAINEEYAGNESLITDNDEVALIPPVSGG